MTATVSASPESISSLSNSVITSPSCRPALAAGPPGLTCTRYAPAWVPSVTLRRAGAEVGVHHLAGPDQLAGRSSRASLIGIAKPTPMLPLWPPLAGLAERGDRGVDADDRAGRGDQRAAGVARVDRGVGLDRVDTASGWPFSPGSRSGRSQADTMPAVTVPRRPSG